MMKTDFDNAQPAPKASGHPAIWPEIIKSLKMASPVMPQMPQSVFDDMQRRHEQGIQKYGMPLTPYNGRDGMMDLYEELLDALAYCAQSIYELPLDRNHRLSDMFSDLSMMLIEVRAMMDEKNGTNGYR